VNKVALIVLALVQYHTDRWESWWYSANSCKIQSQMLKILSTLQVYLLVLLVGHIVILTTLIPHGGGGGQKSAAFTDF
jgi:hypothetical protein